MSPVTPSRRRVVVTGVGLVSPLARRHRCNLARMPRRPIRHRSDHAVRRGPLLDAVRGRSDGIRPAAMDRQERPEEMRDASSSLRSPPRRWRLKHSGLRISRTTPSASASWLAAVSAASKSSSESTGSCSSADPSACRRSSFFPRSSTSRRGRSRFDSAPRGRIRRSRPPARPAHTRLATPFVSSSTAMPTP